MRENDSGVEVLKSGDELGGEYILYFFSIKICIIHKKVNSTMSPAKLIYTNTA
jgi:hypothetical protein